MSVRIALSMALALLLVSGLFFLQLIRREDPMPTDPSAEFLMQLDRDFDRDVAENGLEAWVSHFAPNGSMLGPGQSITGPDAVREAMRPAFENPDWSLRWMPDRGEMLIPGKLGVTSGRFRRRVRSEDGAVVEERGRYVTVWQQQSDGSWKVVMDTGEADPAPAATD